MPLSPGFPTDPHEVIDPVMRWYPGEEELALEEAGKLVPPLVSTIRHGVHQWRTAGYPGVSETSQALLRHWFTTPHWIAGANGADREFEYFFAQREAVETAIWLYEHEKAHDPYSLLRYDATGLVSLGMFSEIWTRYVFKLATGTGKTKVLSLLIAWSYFHRLYEQDSALSTNFLLIAPNIIVLDRLREDFEGLRIFSSDPVLPPNGYEGRSWKSDFQVTLHIQDDVGTVSSSGNLFLSNIHRAYEGGAAPSVDDEDLTDFFLGSKPVSNTTQQMFDLGDVVRKVDHLLVLNDEAHHVHDEKLAWFKAIEGIDARMRQRTGHGIAAQLDVTATPKHADGGVFVQTVCSYPLVEAIRQGVVKTPVVPDEGSRAKLQEHPSDNIYDRYSDHLKLGYLEWAKRREDIEATGKKPVLFIMTTTTAEADEIARYMERTFDELTDRVLVIHTNRSGDVSEAASNKELEIIRRASREIDSPESPYRCVVSVLMLREGWDVENVISMVGLRPFTAKSQVLPEQTLGRGLRRMFRDDPNLVEYLSVVGTEEFLDFVESIRAEGVELERVPMGGDTSPKKPLLVEVDHLDPEKNIDDLDISLPKLSSRVQRQTKNLNDLDVLALRAGEFGLQAFSEAEQREIVFKDLDTDETVWTTDLGEEVVPTPQAVIAYLTVELMRRMRLVGGREILFGKLKEYIRDRLFETAVDLEDLNVLRNLSEPGPRRFLFETFAEAINDLTLVDVGSSTIISEIKISKTRPTVVNNQEFIQSVKTVFNRIVGDSHLELRFAKFLDDASDVQAFFKNARNVHFFIEYLNTNGQIAHYYPDFIVRTIPETVYVVETKGLEDLDVARKWSRLETWCSDATTADPHGRQFIPLYVSQSDFDELETQVTRFEQLATLLQDAQPAGIVQ